MRISRTAAHVKLFVARWALVAIINGHWVGIWAGVDYDDCVRHQVAATRRVPLASPGVNVMIGCRPIEALAEWEQLEWL